MTTSSLLARSAIAMTLAVSLFLQIGCSGRDSFSKAARAGDTVSFAIGRQTNASRDNIVITITDSAGTATTLNPGDPSVRAVFNMYPDPLSYLQVGTETNQELRPSVLLQGIGADGLSDGTRDWWLTVAMVDLPQSMATGPASVDIDINGNITNGISVEVLPGTGSPHNFDVFNAGADGIEKVVNLERTDNYRISIDSVVGTQPQAIEINFTHNPDLDNGGSGKAYVSKALNNKTNLIWTDDGSNLKVILTSANGVITNANKQLQFYISGGITGLQVSSISGFDIDGVTLAGVDALVSPVITSVSPAGPISPGALVSVSGENLCHNCGSPSTDIWIKSGNVWQQITANSIASDLITFNLPGGASSGDATVWISTPGGEDDLWFSI